MKSLEPDSRFFARAAVALCIAALLFLALPVFLTVLGLYVEGLGVFFLLYLLIAIPATVACLMASSRQQWRKRDDGRKLLIVQYGFPIVLVLIFLGLARKR